MSDPSAPGQADDSDDQGLRADAGDPNQDRSDIDEQSPVQLDEEAIRERAEQNDDSTDGLI